MDTQWESNGDIYIYIQEQTYDVYGQSSQTGNMANEAPFQNATC